VATIKSVTITGDLKTFAVLALARECSKDLTLEGYCGEKEAVENLKYLLI